MNVPYAPLPAPAKPTRPDPEKTRRLVGILLYAFFMFCGLALVSLVFLLPAILGDGDELEAMGLGTLLALPPLVVYLWLPWVIDRYDPEPWWALALVLAWGAIAAIGFAGTINTLVHAVFGAIDPALGSFVTVCVSAPFVEEFWKGLAVFGIFYFVRREFDGVVDGIIYATFVALGFAAFENITYYARAALAPDGGALAGTFVIRGVLSPWGHPLYTSMTGIGFGISRETTKGWLRWMAPVFGYFGAVFLHATWNTAATISGFLTIIMLPLWFLVVFAFLGIIIWLVRRKGKIIRDHLQDEVLLGNLTRWELELVCSAFGRMKASFNYGGGKGRKFVATAARLGLCKWHAGRAQRGHKKTVSADWIVPLRQELSQLREEIARVKGGNIERPQMWQAPRAQESPPMPAWGPPGAPPPGGPGYPPQGGGWR